jgi:hypothetical protein
MCSNDKFSQIFHLLFEDAVVASEDEIQKARYRREVGNPPGKPDDPLGDQISWEQFKKKSRESENILIITNDRDYYTDFKGEIYLNSFLYNELVKTNTNTNPSIFCFDSLAKGLDYFRKISSKKIDKLPKEEDLKIIAEEELSNPLPLSNDIFRQVHDINRQFKQGNQSLLESINLQLKQHNFSAALTNIEQILKMTEKS